jgi:hypothetical protein
MPFVYPVFWVHYFLFLMPAMLFVARGLLAEDAWEPAALVALAGCYGLSAWAPARELWTARRAPLLIELWRGHWLWAAPLLAAGCFAAARAHAARDPPG